MSYLRNIDVTGSDRQVQSLLYVIGGHAGEQLPGDDVAAVVIHDRGQIKQQRVVGRYLASDKEVNVKHFMRICMDSSCYSPGA